MNQENLPVIFRKDKECGEIVAFFPTLPGTRDRWTCTSYAHMGQHGSAHFDYYRERTIKATPEEYADLLSELKRCFDYDNLVVRDRLHPSYHDKRLEELKQ